MGRRSAERGAEAGAARGADGAQEADLDHHPSREPAPPPKKIARFVAQSAGRQERGRAFRTPHAGIDRLLPQIRPYLARGGGAGVRRVGPCGGRGSGRSGRDRLRQQRHGGAGAHGQPAAAGAPVRRRRPAFSPSGRPARARPIRPLRWPCVRCARRWCGG